MDINPQECGPPAAGLMIFQGENDPMKLLLQKSLGFAAAVVLLAGGSPAAEIGGDAFHISLPAKFAVASKTSTNKGGVETTTWVSKADDGTAVVVSVSRMPARIADPVKAMDGARDSLLKSVNGTLEREEVAPGDMAARLLLFRSGGAFLRSRLAVDGDRLYSVLYVARSEEQRARPSVAQVFDSFTITPSAVVPLSDVPAAGGGER
jgi:hypothetical protein